MRRPPYGPWFPFVCGLGCGCSLGWAAAPRAWWLALVGIFVAAFVLGTLAVDARYMRRARAKGGERG